jgi:hypothetical protein
VQNVQELPIEIVGSSKFGIWPKINAERTYNMFISDQWLISFAGWRQIESSNDGLEGRGLFVSIRGGFMLEVIDNKVYQLNASGGSTLVGLLDTRVGEVFMDENLAAQICIVDGNDAWIYNYEEISFTKQALDVGYDVIPGYVVYHNSFFLIAPSINDPVNTFNWFAFQYASPSTISFVVNSAFPLQTKPDNCLAIQRLPGKGNNILVLGSTVCEVFTQVGGEENYRRNSSFNIDSGCVSISTIASDTEFVCFLAKNEKSSPYILYTDGGQTNIISTDGIDKFLDSIQFPQDSTGFFFRQDGHLFYILTFFNPADNVTLAYDFTTNMFFHLTNEAFDHHPARKTAFFNNITYFIGLHLGSLFQMSTDIDGAYYTKFSPDGNTIPRIRITNTIKVADSRPFFANNVNFWLEQGNTTLSDIDFNTPECEQDMITEYTGLRMLTEITGDIMVTQNGYCTLNLNWPGIDMSFSKMGNVSYSNNVRNLLNSQGNYRNRMRWFRLGFCNEITFRFQFWGLNRFVCYNGVLEAHL